LKIAVVGNGSIGRRHLRGLCSLEKQLGITEIRGFDTNPERRKLVQDETPSVTSCESLEAAVGGVDAVFLCVPTALHMPVYEQISRFADVHLFFEKPLSHTIEGCEAMLFNQKRLNLKVIVGYMLHYHPVIARAKALLDSGQLGRILSVRAEAGFYLPLWHPWEDYRDFYMSWKTGGGGGLLDLSHEIDYLQWLFGDIEDVQGYVGTVSDLEISSDDMALGILNFKNGIVGQVHLDLLQFDESRGCKVIGTNGVLSFDLMQNTVKYNFKDDTKWKIEEISTDFNAVYSEEYKNVIAAFRGEDAHYVSGKQSFKTMQVIEAIRRSHSYGVRVKLPLYN